MKIAIVGASPIPYTRGGIETFLNGLYQTINNETSHSAELIKVPIRENTSCQVLGSYWKFSRLNLNHFDAVITVKYPAWMIRHDNHIVYLGHRLRGLYDTYPFDPQKERFFSGNPFRFPGPLIRKIVHLLDNRAFSTDRISHVYCTSRTIASRRQYFNDDMPPEVVYHSTASENYTCLPGQHFFTISRLDGPKRIDLLIKAYEKVRGEIPFIIAGSGPQESYLKQLAIGDKRIRFVGDVSNAEMLDLYAKSIAVLYVPKAEDYGLITVEAMKSAKPVITAADSGGPIEFVEDGETGYVCNPDPVSIATAIQNFVDDKESARRMGEAGWKISESITWKSAVSKILAPYDFWPERRSSKIMGRRRIVVLVPYPVFPVRSGGQLRIASLYGELSRIYDVWLITLGRSGQRHQTLRINHYLHEVRIPPSPRHSEKQWEYEKNAGVEISDAALTSLIHLTPNYLRAARYFGLQADVVVSSHPYLHPIIRKMTKCRNIVHESHNFEYELKKAVLEKTSVGRGLLKAVYHCEKTAVQSSAIVLSTCREESKKLADEYHTSMDRFEIVPNGVNTDLIKPADPSARNRMKKELGIDGKTTVIFIGAWHPPNLEAFCFIKDRLAPQMPAFHFLIIGSVKSQYEARIGPLDVPGNCTVYGEIDEELKFKLLQCADLAVNPMFSGSGTNLKILEYFAGGIPVVSTELGVRGLGSLHPEIAIVCEANAFASELGKLAESQLIRETMSRNARKLVEDRYSWSRIADTYIERLETLFPVPDIGNISMEDSSWFEAGWHSLERWPMSDKTEMSVRWTHPYAQIRLPNPRRTCDLILNVLGGNNCGKLTILIDGVACFEEKPEPRWQQIRIPLPRHPGVQNFVVQLNYEAWSPSDSGSSDTRVLGIAVSEIRIV